MQNVFAGAFTPHTGVPVTVPAYGTAYLTTTEYNGVDIVCVVLPADDFLHDGAPVVGMIHFRPTLDCGWELADTHYNYATRLPEFLGDELPPNDLRALADVIVPHLGTSPGYDALRWNASAAWAS